MLSPSLLAGWLFLCFMLCFFVLLFLCNFCCEALNDVLLLKGAMYTDIIIIIIIIIVVIGLVPLLNVTKTLYVEVLLPKLIHFLSMSPLL